MKVPIEIKIDNNGEKIFYLESGEEYYLGRVGEGHYHKIREKFGYEDEYKFSIYLFKKNEMGFLDIVGIVSKGIYKAISRYHFKILVSKSGDVIISADEKNDYRHKKPTYSTVYAKTGDTLIKEKLSIDEYLNLIISGDSNVKTVNVRVGLVSPIDIIGPDKFKKGDILKYRIRIKIKEIMENNELINYNQGRDVIQLIVISAHYDDDNGDNEEHIKLSVQNDFNGISIQSNNYLEIKKLDYDGEIIIHTCKEKKFYFECCYVEKCDKIDVKSKKSKDICPNKYSDVNVITKILSIGFNDLVNEV